MNVFLKNLITALLMGSTLVPALAYAAESTSTATETLVNQLQTVQNELSALRAQQQTQQPTTTTVAAGLVSQLHEGSMGSQVRILQALLATDPSLYPEGIISGFYGKLTANAVARFQKKNGLAPVGYVGPKTLQALQALLNRPPTPEAAAITSVDDAPGGHPCTIVPPGHLIASGFQKNNGAATTSVVLECENIPPGIYAKLVAASSTVKVSTSTDTTAPNLWGVTLSQLNPTSAVVSWHTSEAATTEVRYLATSTTTPDFSNASSTIAADLKKDHSVTLTGLLPSTMYRFTVVSADAAGNTATTSSYVLITPSI